MQRAVQRKKIFHQKKGSKGLSVIILHIVPVFISRKMDYLLFKTMVSKLRLLRLPPIQFCFLPSSFVLNHHKPKTMYQGAPLCLSRQEMYSCSVFTSHTVAGRRDCPDTGPRACDGLLELHIAMKQHCMRDS